MRILNENCPKIVFLGIEAIASPDQVLAAHFSRHSIAVAVRLCLDPYLLKLCDHL